MPTWDDLFGKDGLSGPRIRGGKKEGSWRPGHRSREIQLDRATMVKRPGAAPPRRAQPGGEGVLHRPTPSPAPAGGPMVRRPVPGGAVVSRLPRGAAAALATQSAPVARRPLPTIGPMARRIPPGVMNGLFGDGYLGDGDADATPDDRYVPNGEIWISNQPVALYWRTWSDWRQEALWRWQNYMPKVHGAPPVPQPPDPWLFDEIITPYQVPVLYPDGSPVVGHVWLPKINLTRDMGAAYFSDSRRVISQRRLWEIGTPPTNLASKDFYPHYLDEAGSIPLADEEWRTHVFDASGGHAQQFESRLSFDWSKSNPTYQAYPWIYDNLTDGSLYKGNTGKGTSAYWRIHPGDLYRSDGQSIAGNFPHRLPPMPFYCLEFLDAVANEEHGLEGIHDADGRLNINAFQALMHDVPFWSLNSSVTQGLVAQFQTREPNLQRGSPPPPPLLYTDYDAAFGNEPFLLAVDYDIGGLPVFGTQDAAPQPNPNQPKPAPAPAPTGGPKPFDPNDPNTWYGPDDPDYPNGTNPNPDPAPYYAPTVDDQPTTPTQQWEYYPEKQEQYYVAPTVEQPEQQDAVQDESGMWWWLDASTGAYYWWDDSTGNWIAYAAAPAASATGAPAAIGIAAVLAVAAKAAGLF